jgi:hypothetical protein
MSVFDDGFESGDLSGWSVSAPAVRLAPQRRRFQI